MRAILKDYQIPFKFKSEHPKTWFFDLDGTILEYNLIFSAVGKDKLLPGVKELWDKIPEDDFIVLVTARPNYLKDVTLKFLEKKGIRFDHVIFDLPRGERILVNDEKPGNIQTAYSWNVKRNEGF
jgi:histidinol phosphatase-like enzyme